MPGILRGIINRANAPMCDCRLSKTKHQQSTLFECDLNVGSVRMEDGTKRVPVNREDYKLNAYYPVLDPFLLEPKQHITSRNIEIMKAIQACNPPSKFFDA